ncbi:serine carboxypeptidase-like 4 [Ziziphus jujuba]|uniref:Serine carboxypeptidase-like 4 n=1 Tax=Ziziphus jujuba TaxID=326968 RepID=A0ABM3ZSF9_ZIZJJ|nr:serine carboxypeptidase-like 4 [Ziziphus jujuba]
MPLNFFNFIGFPLSYLLLLFLQAALLSNGSIVKTLPGFPGVLPFKLETGYVRVEESELFYYFVESQGQAPFDPFILYPNGGPSCSGLNDCHYQAGPLVFNIADYTGGLLALS